MTRASGVQTTYTLNHPHGPIDTITTRDSSSTLLHLLDYTVDQTLNVDTISETRGSGASQTFEPVLMSIIETIILLVPAVSTIGSIAVVVAYVWATRIGFGRYLQRMHPDTWAQLVAPGDAWMGRGIASDVSHAVARFRRESSEDLGDPEVARRRRIANTLERASVIGWIACAGLLTLAIGVIAVLRTI